MFFHDVGAAARPGEDVVGPFYVYIAAQSFLKNPQFRRADAGAGGCGRADGTMVLDKQVAAAPRWLNVYS